ncbi:MAG TPA: DNA mismatch repair endonuclease MutL, partial [Ktedonobacterales bacterium]|nr:DNA mismatch repair endonuclease MutL [Ktedonobacterales bacterium]
IELRHGGLRLIRVADDGCGMISDDLPLACAQHATSKVATLSDLEHISTLGFRGEALASVAAVAELEIASADDDSGMAHVVIAGPERPPTTSAASRPRGTTGTVRDLFATVPARQALLRGSRTEAGRIAALVRAYALIHPDTRFLLLSDGHLTLQTHGNGLHAAIADLYGPDVERALLPIGPLEIQSCGLDGVVASHAFSHPTRDHVVLAINGRPVHNRTLLAALESGYRPLLRKGRHPVLVAHITMAPERLDANIHPAKFEVLLKDEALIAPALREAVHRALGSVPRSATLSTHASALPQNPPVQLRLPLPRKRRGLLLGERQHQYAIPPQHEDAEETLEGVPALEALAQFDDTLILARAADGHLYLVDQHRAHERVLYEQLLRKRTVATGRSLGTLEDIPEDTEAQDAHAAVQLLLEPVLVELTPRQAEQLEPRLHELSTLGLDCQPFGGSVFLVRSVPDIAGATQSLETLPVTPAAAFARALAEDAAVVSADWLDYLCISLACRSAVRRGQSLGPHQRQSLLDELREVAAPALCPHGSPLIVRLTRSYLTRAFEW